MTRQPQSLQPEKRGTRGGKLGHRFWTRRTPCALRLLGKDRKVLVSFLVVPLEWVSPLNKSEDRERQEDVPNLEVIWVVICITWRLRKVRAFRVEASGEHPTATDEEVLKPIHEWGGRRGGF